MARSIEDALGLISQAAQCDSGARTHKPHANRQHSDTHKKEGAHIVQIINNKTELAPLDAVRPHPRNPRQGDTGAIHESITANGFYGAIIAQKSTGFILAGNHRWQAAQQAGATEVPVTWVDVDDDHALRILLADNRTNDLATYDDETLVALLNDLNVSERGLAGTGYDTVDLDELIAELAPPLVTPVEQDTQARLDEPKKITCPECGHEFAP